MTAMLAGMNDFNGMNNIHPVGAVAVALATIAILSTSRVHVPAVLLALAAFIPSTQRIVIAGADFNFIRFVVLFGLIRVIARGEFRWLRWNWIDTAVVVGALARTVCSPVARGSLNDLISSVGSNFELVGAYLLFRVCIRSLEDVRTTARSAAWICALAVPLFLVERATGRNLFSVFGGIPDITAIREGRIRCRGAFSHAILAGCFFVSFLPLWIGLALRGRTRDRATALMGIVSGFLIVFCCASSTPVVALLLGAMVWLAFPVRAHLRLLWITAIGCGFVVHFLMERGIWHLIGRIDLVGGSTGVHRARLIEAAIRQFGEWWMFGTASTAHWGWGLFDVTNQFILEGVRGGVWALLAMVVVLILGYRSVGVGLRWVAKLRVKLERSRQTTQSRDAALDEATIFAIGAVLCAQMAIFLAVSYFGQTVVIWQLAMALAASLCQMTSDFSIVGRSYASSPTITPTRVPSVPSDGRLSVSPMPVLSRGSSCT